MNCSSVKGLVAILSCAVILIFASPLFAKVAKDDSLSTIKQRGELLVGMDTAELPWVGKNSKTGQLEGFEFELMELLAKKLGVKLRVVNEHWSKLGNALVEKKFDIIANAYSEDNVSKDLKEKISWSVPYYTWGWAIAVRADDNSIKGLGDLRGKVVGCFTDGKEYFSKMRGFKKLKVYPKAAYDQLLSKKIDAFIYDSPSVYYTAKTNQKLKAVGQIIEGNKVYKIGVRNGETELLKKIDRVMAKIVKSKKYKTIMDRWQERSKD